MQSPAEHLAALSPARRDAVLATLSEGQCGELLYDWRAFMARPDQIPPPGDWDIWMVLAGRGFGKTRTGAEFIRERIKDGARRIALVGETQKDLEEVMVEGESGLLSVFPPSQRPVYRKKPVRLCFPNGAVALGYNATQPEQLRGPQFDTAWCDELAKWRYARQTWDNLQFGMRLSAKPRQVITTTPRPIELIKSLLAGGEGKTHITRGRTLDNSANLAGPFLEKITQKYAGTRLGRQELDGELLGDIPGALWRLETIDIFRLDQPPELERIVVAVDPAVTHTEHSDEHGLIVAGVSGSNGYVLEDASVHGSPLLWARRAVALHDKYAADGIVVEVNQGGDMVAHTLRSVRAELNIIEVRATRGKHVRAEPIAALYEQGRIHHIGAFPDLEAQMVMTTTAGYESDGSPDRLDALVWALTELFPQLIETKPRSMPKFRTRRVI